MDGRAAHVDPGGAHERDAGRAGDTLLLHGHQLGVEPPQRHVVEPADGAARLRDDRGCLRHPGAADPVASRRTEARPAAARRWPDRRHVRTRLLGAHPGARSGGACRCPARRPGGGGAADALQLDGPAPGLRRARRRQDRGRGRALCRKPGARARPHPRGSRDDARPARPRRGGKRKFGCRLSRSPWRALAPGRARVRRAPRRRPPRSDRDRDSLRRQEGGGLGLRPASRGLRGSPRPRGVPGKPKRRARALVAGSGNHVRAAARARRDRPGHGCGHHLRDGRASRHDQLLRDALFALVLPFTSVAVSLLYLDLASRRDSEGSSPGMLPAP